jgi:tRNA(Ile)-lysidine synthase
MKSGFEDKVAAFVRAYDLIAPRARIIAAVSGGADSVALLHVLFSLRGRGVFSLDLVCAHVNHKLRGSDSDADQQFVRSQAEALGIPFLCTSLDVTGYAREHRLSIETAARALRMEALLEMTRQGHGQAIATGHQEDDNAETIVYRLARGTGLRGLAGIWPSRALDDGLRLIRPLLCVTRREVLGYLHEKKLSWREDATNADLRFRRNAIRHKLLPALQGVSHSSLVGSLSGLALSTYGLYTQTVLPVVDRLWPTAISCTHGETLSLNVKAVEGQPPFIQIELIRQVLARLGCGERDLTDLHYTRLLSLIATKTSGRAVSLPGGFMARRRANDVRIGRPEPMRESAPEGGEVSLEVPGQARWGRYLIETEVLALDEVQGRHITNNTCRSIEWLDGDKLKPPLVLRPYRPGDRFRPLGQAREKKVGRFLIDARIPQEDREEILVMEDQEKIVWVCPLRLSDRVKVTESTRRVVQIQVRPGGRAKGT